MSAFRLTLNNRIVTLLVVFSVILISAFTFIQLRNQLGNITLFNIYRARIGPVITRTMLEGAVRQTPADGPFDMVQKAVDQLYEKKIADKSLVYDTSGVIVASSDFAYPTKSKLSDYEITKTAEMIKSGKTEMTDINEKLGTIDVYLILSDNYAAKSSFSLGNIQEALNQVYGPVILVAGLITLACILFGLALSKTVIGPIAILNEATKDIAAGNLDLRIKVNTQDELEELSETFNEMTVALKRMKSIAENANPLTHLPGNNVIREEAERRIKEHRKFVVIHSDLDNFKAFNDKYGLLKGDEAILMTCQVLRDAIKAKGNSDDFVGHEGGDDFVLVTTPEKDGAIADYIVSEFDARARALYSKEDLDAGHIIAKGRDGNVHQFPIMTISLSGISNVNKHIESYAEITNIAAEVKKKAKAIEKSVYVLDKRTRDGDHA